MAFNEKQYLDLLGLQKYDELIKQYANASDATLKAALDAEVLRATQAEEAIANDLVTLEGELKAVAKSGKAEDVTIADVEGKLEAANVEDALKEIISKISGAQEAGAVTVVKDEVAGEYAAVYHVQQNGINVGVPINVPKDYLVKSAEIKECAEVDVPTAGLQVGDKYIDFVINSVNGEGNESHIYLKVQDLIEDFTVAAGATEVQLAISPTREVSATLVDGGVSTTKIADKAVTLAKLSEELQTWKAGIDTAIGEGGSVAEQIAKAVKAEADLREAADNALSGRLDTAETNITRIDGDDATEGSFRKAVKDEADRATQAEADLYASISSIPEASILALFAKQPEENV